MSRKKAGRIMLIISFVLLGCLLIIAGVLLAYSPGKPRPFLDGRGKPLAGSLSEKIRVPINGVQQGMFIKGKDKTKPVLLFLHGGPGMPEPPWSGRYVNVLEDDFVVCWWEQRGSGLSCRRDIPPETMTVEQFISDTNEVAAHLRKHFGRDKIYIMAHSWGSFIGIQAAARRPDLYEAYIGMAQVSRQIESEKLAWRYMHARYAASGNGRMARKLERFPIPEMESVPQSYRGLRDKTMHELGIGTTHAMKSVIAGIFLPVMLNREYTLGEKIGIWRGKWSKHSVALWDRMMATDLTALVSGLEIPVYFFHGRHDYTASYPLARDFFDKLRAPLKGFFTFQESAHSPLFEEPEKARRILREDVLSGANALADGK